MTIIVIIQVRIITLLIDYYFTRQAEWKNHLFPHGSRICQAYFVMSLNIYSILFIDAKKKYADV